MTFITADDQSTPLKLFLYLIDCWVNFFWLIPKRTQKFTAWWLHESSRERCSTKKDVLSNFAKSTGKHLCQSLFFDKVADLTPATLLKKSLWHSCFPLNFAKFLKTSFFQNTSGQLLLTVNILVTHFRPTFPFYTPWKRQKSSGFLKFSGA